MRKTTTRRAARLKIAQANYYFWMCLNFWAYQMRRLGSTYSTDDKSDLYDLYPHVVRPTPAWKTRFQALWNPEHPFAIEEQFQISNDKCLELYKKGQ